MVYLLIFTSSSFQFLFIPCKAEIAPCNVPPKNSLINSFNSIVLPSTIKLTSNKITPRIYYHIKLKFFFLKPIIYNHLCFFDFRREDKKMLKRDNTHSHKRIRNGYPTAQCFYPRRRKRILYQ